MKNSDTKASILVVEDDAELANTLVETLNDLGLTAFSATTVRAAGFKLKNQLFSCVILDIRLGEETGEVVIDIMKQNKKSLNVETPILLMSGNIDLGLIKKIGSKVQGAIVKPFTPKDLLKKLKPILRKAKS